MKLPPKHFPTCLVYKVEKNNKAEKEILKKKKIINSFNLSERLNFKKGISVINLERAEFQLFWWNIYISF